MSEGKKGLTGSLFKGITRNTMEALAIKMGIKPSDRAWVTVDIGASLASVSIKVATEFFKAAPEAARYLNQDDLRVWAEFGRRIALDNAEEANEFFRHSPETLAALPSVIRPLLVALCAKQIVLSPQTALLTFYGAPRTASLLSPPSLAHRLFSVAVAVANRSVKHSSEVLAAAPQAITALKQVEASLPNEDYSYSLADHALEVAEQFATRTGATAAEFLAATGEGMEFVNSTVEAKELLTETANFLERGGATALQYFRAARAVIESGGPESYAKWSWVTRRVADEGNALVYDFLKLTPKVMSALSANQRRQMGRGTSENRGPSVIQSVLDVTEELAGNSVYVAMECFKSAPRALANASLDQFQSWARGGAGLHKQDRRRAQAYYALESKSSQEALREAQGGVTLDSVAHLLRLYVEGLTGREMMIAPTGAIPDESRISDGTTIQLPAMVAEFGSPEDDFRLYKVLAAHAAGQVEFGTRDIGTSELRAALREIDTFFAAWDEAHSRLVDSELADEVEAPVRKRSTLYPEHFEAADYKLSLSRFPNAALATRIFTTLENGRIDYRLRRAYRGIRRDLNFVRARLIDHRPPVSSLPVDQLLYEILFQITLCGGVVDQTARRAYADVIQQFEGVVADYLYRDDAGVADTLMATRRVYELLNSQRAEQPAESQQDDQQQESDEEEQESRDSAGKQQPQQSQQRRVMEALSHWAEQKEESEQQDSEVLNEQMQAESSEQELQEGDQAFFYDEWDRELGDYRAKWCRVIQRENRRGMRDFVEQVRARYAGVISSIRHQFQMLKPESLRKIKGELDGEDYDLQAVIDRHVDLRTTGRASERIYVRRIRRERDVAVSFLLDMSSSTARTITRHPNQPYTRPGQKIIDIEKQGLVLMSEALEAVGDTYAIFGFTSEGRRNVKYFVIKNFGEKYGPEVERRIGGITYHNNTRLGAAIRHNAAQLEKQDARTKLLIVLSDGRPYDHDYGDSRYAREDTKMALRQAKVHGITPFCITIDRDSEAELKDLYGEVGYTIIDDVMSLPERLPGIYRRLTT
jgi:nitric oxide reductase NorD protein